MEGKDLQTRLSVGVVSWLVLELLDSDLSEEDLHDAQEVIKPKVSVDDEALDLMELCEVSSIEVLIAVNSIDGEVLHRLEDSLPLCLFSKLV